MLPSLLGVKTQVSATSFIPMAYNTSQEKDTAVYTMHNAMLPADVVR